MAPEEGLEPSTPRLTAACSTIELLWIPKADAHFSRATPDRQQGFALLFDAEAY